MLAAEPKGSADAVGLSSAPRPGPREQMLRQSHEETQSVC